MRGCEEKGAGGVCVDHVRTAIRGLFDQGRGDQSEFELRPKEHKLEMISCQPKNLSAKRTSQ